MVNCMLYVCCCMLNTEEKKQSKSDQIPISNKMNSQSVSLSDQITDSLIKQTARPSHHHQLFMCCLDSLQK